MITSDISNRVRRDIVNGRFSLNAKLPTREEFSRTYGASKATVQKALATLEDEGFVVSRGTRGTFINPKSPNLTNIAVLIPVKENQLSIHGGLFNLLHQQHQNLERHTGKFLRYFYIDEEQRIQDDFKKVAEEARYTRLSGVIFPFAPRPWMLEPFQKNHIPVVAFTDEHVNDASTVWIDYTGFMHLALEFCQSQGCRQPKLLSTFTLPYHYIEDYLNIARQYGFPDTQETVLPLPLQYSLPWLKHCLQIFLNTPGKADAIILNDETMLEHTLRVLLELGAVPGKDLTLVSHRTFPAANTPILPVACIGFDLYEIIDSCLKALGKLRRDKKNTEKFIIVNAKKEV
ncbi:MAG: winged helix-turn-helix domain-containing protein [Victivallaceae bacterium]